MDAVLTELRQIARAVRAFAALFIELARIACGRPPRPVPAWVAEAVAMTMPDATDGPIDVPWWPEWGGIVGSA